MSALPSRTAGCFFGPCHLRMNLASPRSRIEEAFRRMDRYVFNRLKIHSAIHYNLCYNRAHNISVPSCHFPERCKQEEINMDIKEEIHALSEEMLTNLGRLVAIDSQLGTPSEGKPFGEGPAKALEEGLKIAEELGF